MKLLLFSDVHANENYCKELVSRSREVDLVIAAGDYGRLRRDLRKTIKWLSGIRKSTLLVPGNAESYEELKEACTDWPHAIVLHGNGMEFQGMTFYGMGGGIPVTPFGSWSWDFTEKEAKKLLEDCPNGAVLISHSPPFGVLDISSSGQHLGSMAVRECIDKKSLKLLICGHIHESGGKIERLCDTVILNAGPRGIFYEVPT